MSIETAEARRLAAMEEIDELWLKSHELESKNFSRRKSPEQIRELSELYRRRNLLMAEVRRLKSYIHTEGIGRLKEQLFTQNAELALLRDLRSSLRSFVNTGHDWPNVIEKLTNAEKGPNDEKKTNCR